jgi:protein-S-isoprenylcysteine O-methyltransferase Ste14
LPEVGVVSNLSRRALSGFVNFQVFLGFVLFLPAWSLDFWQAWLYWALFGVLSLAVLVYFLEHDPKLIGRRMEVGPGAEARGRQKVLQAIASLLLCTTYVVAGLDHRLGWSSIPVPLVLAADALVIAGFLGFFLTFRANSYTAATVRVEEGQGVISSGPYRLVRHPLYAASMLLFLATPVALGSSRAILPAVLLCLVIVLRLLDEERLLSAQLAGYDAYRLKVRYRLIPLVW